MREAAGDQGGHEGRGVAVEADSGGVALEPVRFGDGLSGGEQQPERPGRAGSSVSRAMTTGPVFNGKLPATPSLRLQWVYWVASSGSAARAVAAAPQCQSRTTLASASRSTVSTR